MSQKKTSVKKKRQNDPLLIFACILGVAVLIAISFVLRRMLTNQSSQVDPGWHIVDGKTFYIDAVTKQRAVGLNTIGNKAYYFQSDGTVKQGWATYEGEQIYVQSNGLVSTGECEIDGDVYSFAFDTFKMLKNTYIEQNDGTAYYFGDDGKAVKGICSVKGQDMYFDEGDCTLVRGLWLKMNDDDDANYYADEDGVLASGWVTIAGKQHYFLQDHRAASGKIKVDGTEYNFDSYGLDINTSGSVTTVTDTGEKPEVTTSVSVTTAPVSETTAPETTKQDVKSKEGWREVDGKKQFVYRDGAVATGTQRIDNVLYTFNQSGFVNYGWLEIGGNKFHSNEEGVADTGFTEIEGQTYYFDNLGRMQKGIQNIDGAVYYFNSSGHMAKGEKVNIDGNSYYFGNDGKRGKGFQIVDGYTYYFSEKNSQDGVMQKGYISVNGKEYYMDNEGRQIVGWVDMGSFRYYFAPEEVKGTRTIDGTVYNFDPSEGMLLKEDGSCFIVGED